jgi:predicted nucleic acid-binding Zn ribbon protein
MSARRSGRRKSEPTEIGSMMDKVLSDLGLDAAAASFRIGQRWEAAVGPDIARHCQPVGMRGSVLEVNVDTSVWCQQLQLRRTKILAALKSELGTDAPGDLRFRVGYIPAP